MKHTLEQRKAYFQRHLNPSRQCFSFVFLWQSTLWVNMTSWRIKLKLLWVIFYFSITLIFNIQSIIKFHKLFIQVYHQPIHTSLPQPSLCPKPLPCLGSYNILIYSSWLVHCGVGTVAQRVKLPPVMLASLATPLLIQFPANAPAKQTTDCPYICHAVPM